MPVTKSRRAEYNREWRKRYPEDWPAWKKRIRERSKGRCECTGECGLHIGARCPEINGKIGVNMAGRVVLAAAHRNHVERDCRDDNLFDACQRCHLRYDRVIHAEGARKTRNKKTGQIDAIDEMEFQKTLTMLLQSLEASPMKVILMDAPEKKHEGHKIRVVESRPPTWYLNLCERWGYRSGGRGYFIRYRFINAMNRARDGVFTGGSYMEALLETVKAAQRDPEEIFCR